MSRARTQANCARIVLIALLVTCAPSLASTEKSLSDIAPAVDGLLGSPAEDAFLVIGISGTADFVQLGGHLGSAFLDFPQITARQQQLRGKIETVCSELGLTLEINVASSGAEFLDYPLSGSAKDMAAIVEQVLIRVYGVDQDTALEFETNGF